MRRIATLSVVAFLVTTGSAYAVTDTTTMTARLQMAATPASGSPASLAYQWRQNAGTSPAGQQPDSVSSFTVSFAKEIVSNAQYFPACDQADIDGIAAFPPACQAAIVGSGQATIYAGSPGSPQANSVREDLSVTLVNGTPAGQKWLLYMKSAPNAPVALERVYPGTVVPASDPFGFALRFDVPADLQSQLGLTLTLTELVVSIPSTQRSVTIGGTPTSASFLAMTACSGSVPARLLTEFGSTNYPGPALEANTTAACDFGPGFPDYPGLPDYPVSPPVDGGGGNTGGSGGDGTPGGANTGGSNPPAITSSTPPAPGPVPPPRIAGASSLKAVTVGAGGTFTLPGVVIACPAASGGPCTVDGDAEAAAGASKVRKPVVLAKVRFSLKAGRSSAVKLRLTKQGKRLLTKKRLLKLVVHLRVREPNGAQAARTFKARVKAAKPARRH